MKKSTSQIYLITIACCILLVQVFYFIQVNFVFKNTKYLSPAIITPILLGAILGIITGYIYNQRLKIQQQEDIIGNLQITEIINNILLLSKNSSEPIAFLKSIIDTILEANFLKIDSRLGFFLKDPDGRMRIKVQHKLSNELLNVCGKDGIVAGECVCGQAISTKEIQYANCFDKLHSISYEGMKNLPHYNVPLIYDQEVMGVMVVYLEERHKKNEREESFLVSISGIIALVLHKYQREKEKNREILALNDELSTQNKVLTKRNHELDRFVYSTSHDLRSPIVSILGILDLFKNDILKGEEKIQTINLMKDSLEKTDEMITNILDYSKNMNAEVNYELTDIKLLIDEVLAIHKFIDGEEIAIEKNITVEKIQMDKYRFKTILNNLFSNAIKYRRKETPLKLKVTFTEYSTEEYQLSVEDNGEGIEETELNKIFEMFHRSSSSARGAGLGLYICKEILHNLNGRMTVESALGSWTIFTIYIPKYYEK